LCATSDPACLSKCRARAPPLQRWRDSAAGKGGMKPGLPRRKADRVLKAPLALRLGPIAGERARRRSPKQERTPHASHLGGKRWTGSKRYGLVGPGPRFACLSGLRDLRIRASRRAHRPARADKWLPSDAAFGRVLVAQRLAGATPRPGGADRLAPEGSGPPLSGTSVSQRRDLGQFLAVAASLDMPPSEGSANGPLGGSGKAGGQVTGPRASRLPASGWPKTRRQQPSRKLSSGRTHCAGEGKASNKWGAASRCRS
jgi:hypothetical protein